MYKPKGFLYHRISASIPAPPIVFAAPPELIVIPDTYVYVAPDIDVDSSHNALTLKKNLKGEGKTI